MILFFVLFLVLAGLALQKWMVAHGLQGVQSTYRPDENIVDAGDVFFILIEIENHSKWPIPYVKVKMYFDRDIQVMESTMRFEKERRTRRRFCGNFCLDAAWAENRA